MLEAQIFDTTWLNAHGLNLQAVFERDQLPAALAQGLDVAGEEYRQVILLGHAGQSLWQAVQASGINSADPIDDFSVRVVEQWLARTCPTVRHEIAYPGQRAIALQGLGQLAGWHHDSPFMLGVRPVWGSWYAYRVLLLADTSFAPTARLDELAPCLTCQTRPCLAACPGEALAGGSFALQKCVTWRRQAASPCRDSCPARIACPVGSEHRYCRAQMEHSYAISLRMIERHGGI